MKKIGDLDIQQIIGWILRLGVIISMTIVFIGGCFYWYRHSGETASYSKFVGVPDFVHSASGIWHGILTLRGRAIIQAGIILLIATPVITLLVLGIILLSAFTGHAG
jgi:uncharacterized membrane protein